MQVAANVVSIDALERLPDKLASQLRRSVRASVARRAVAHTTRRIRLAAARSLGAAGRLGV
eukprot:1489508-Pyramimonas_sp.AAC.1